ncbi:MAG: hypothetical protein GYB65_16605 [Chloroflexi bacterium]|nr:hypothetical protein [Chloroflexota bacterium]
MLDLIFAITNRLAGTPRRIVIAIQIIIVLVALTLAFTQADVAMAGLLTSGS